MPGAERPRTLAELGLSDAPGTVTGLTADSRAVRPGFLFAALPGVRAHGADFAAQAVAAGAVAVLTDAEGAARAGALPVPVLPVPDPRRAFALAAAAFHGAQPAVVVAVTGTNGKSSVVSFLRQIWTALGHRAVSIGTLGIQGAVEAPGALTTPDPVTLHRWLADLAGQGVSHVAIEASSHGLDQRRLDGVRLTAAGFTNLSRDHLDYHGSEEAYLAAKLGLFDRVLPAGGHVAANLDDPAAAAVRRISRARGQPFLGVGRHPDALLRLLDAVHAPEWIDLQFAHAGSTYVSRLSLIGDFQAANALLAAALAIQCDAPAGRVFALLPHLKGVQGRMQLAGITADGGAVYVDYAHTPQALEAALRGLRPHVAGRILCVFGAGGDRDAGKRPLMGRAVAAHADAAIVTDDNPRGEDPAAIRAAILAGCPGAREIGDRAEAIRAGVAMLGPDDALLIAGKGHETGQEVAGRVLPFDDLSAARAAIIAAGGQAS
ncbi:MAG: UDP-N-acetylmuramoyl-L-alanyl-D-glutamate--2,6-diaminopimelate ligase [Paracoccaceae bacterium]|nr:MAG: UDP-N-acetylmuramoyl-L-alanyl-D-glutamate--2,6-diaminopimelate ligase [Paracoccaceae bacterium]